MWRACTIPQRRQNIGHVGRQRARAANAFVRAGAVARIGAQREIRRQRVGAGIERVTRDAEARGRNASRAIAGAERAQRRLDLGRRPARVTEPGVHEAGASVGLVAQGPLEETPAARSSTPPAHRARARAASRRERREAARRA